MNDPFHQGLTPQISLASYGHIDTTLDNHLQSVARQNADTSTQAVLPFSSPETRTMIVATATSNAESVRGVICPDCQKPYRRNCDLKRHLKTHTRPHKCPVSSCSYSTTGFPTPQELLRHKDDRHSNKPPEFKCQFAPCSYRSKRESNCKQHMANVHSLAYKYSRKSHRARVAATITKPDSCTQGVRPGDTDLPYFDFTLYPDQDQDQQQTTNHPLTPAPDVVYGNDDTPVVCLGGNIADVGDESGSSDQSIVSNSFVPWESPMTQQEEIHNMIQNVDSNFDPTQPVYDSNNCSQSQYPLSIRSPFIDQLNTADMSPPTMSHPSSLWLHPLEAVQSCQDLQPYISVPSFVDGLGSVGVMQAAGPRESYSNQIVSQATERVVLCSPVDEVAAEKRKRDRDEESDEDDDEDDEHRRKRPRPDGETDDSSLTCPFRKMDSNYYSRDRDERYSSCYTPHVYISTRHLGRAAHGLLVTPRSISSFDVLEEGYPRPRAGLCRKCWRPFHDRNDFDTHVTAPNQCGKASRGKREKYNAIINAFCVHGDGSDVSVSYKGRDLLPAQPIRRNTRSTRRDDQSQAQTSTVPRLSVEFDAARGTPDIKESPTQQELKVPLQTAHLVTSDFVPRIEYQGLERRVEDLEAAIQQMTATGQAQSSSTAPRFGRQSDGDPRGRVVRDIISHRRPIRSATSGTDESALEIGSLGGWMERQERVEEDERAMLGTNQIPGTSVDEYTGAIPDNSAQDLAGISRPHRTSTNLSSRSDTSSLRHAPPMALRSDARSQVPSRQQQQVQPQQQATSNTVLDSGYGGSSKPKASQQPDGSTAPPATALNPGTPDTAPYISMDRTADSALTENHVAELPQGGYPFDDGVEGPSMFAEMFLTDTEGEVLFDNWPE
ncbi:c2h2 transcription factor [Grosmannia clavigera kw1407]|uniref:C2h2 transcription factor n=1 Tax=Grosmannia clavigera (strain kw1407 / UAMH 11150) TaxID=655863 RepID=F0XPS1_GROCL|nr:c2h2 transcription factor [Grosmannia clavigera kw1407]EFX00639.1 c2h2 transcription factor [Grosmannia clavigera kw1407]